MWLRFLSSLLRTPIANPAKQVCFSATKRAWATAWNLEADSHKFKRFGIFEGVAEHSFHATEKHFKDRASKFALGICHHKLAVNTNRQRLAVEIERELVLFSIHGVGPNRSSAKAGFGPTGRGCTERASLMGTLNFCAAVGKE